jgi:hypothetical protein
MRYYKAAIAMAIFPASARRSGDPRLCGGFAGTDAGAEADAGTS